MAHANFLGNSLMSWSSRKQNIIAFSFTKSEYVTARSCCAKILWMKYQLENYGINPQNIPIKCDNTSVIALTKTLVFHALTKHIEIKHHFI